MVSTIPKHTIVVFLLFSIQLNTDSFINFNDQRHWKIEEIVNKFGLMSMNWSLNNWLDTIVQGEFAEDENAVKEFLLTNKFTSPRALSTLEMADMASSRLPLGRQKTLLSFTAPFRAQFGMNTATSNFLFVPPLS